MRKRVFGRDTFRAAVIATGVAASAVVAQSCPPGGHPVADFGSFTAGQSDSATIAQNHATINAAIASVGQAGGGTVCIPEGTYCIGPDPALDDAAISIDHSNISLRGAGADKTVLRTNGTWNATRLRRGHGIIIRGTNSCSAPRKNIILRDFELDGQAGWTGNYCWDPAATCGENGWDVSHKGIVPAWDACTDSVTLENLYVHHFRGEILYCGGMGMGRLVVRNVTLANTNGSDFNLYGADLLVERCTFDGPSRFWCELTARANQGAYPNNRAVFRNNVFRNAVGATAIVMCQGDFQAYSFTFDSNTITGCPGAFAAYGGVAGPATITNNRIDSCAGAVLEFGQAPGWVNSPASANITMENNVVTRSGMLVSFSASQQNITIRANDFSGKSSTNLGSSTALFYGAANLANCVVERNTFRDCRTPEQTAGISGTRPLFAGNTYVNVERRHTHGLDWINASSPKATPHCDEHQIFTDVNNSVVELEDSLYPHGQIVKLFGGSPTHRVRFAAGQGSYTVASDRYLDGADSLWFRYDTAQAKWIEYVPTAVPPARAAVPSRAATQIAVFSISGRCLGSVGSEPEIRLRSGVCIVRLVDKRSGASWVKRTILECSHAKAGAIR